MREYDTVIRLRYVFFMFLFFIYSTYHIKSRSQQTYSPISQKLFQYHATSYSNSTIKTAYVKFKLPSDFIQDDSFNWNNMVSLLLTRVMKNTYLVCERDSVSGNV